MPQIWELKSDVNNYQQLALLHLEKDWEIPTYSFNGIPLIGQWNPLDVYIENPELLPSDFPSITGIPLIVTETSYSALFSVIGNHVEFLPLNCTDCNLKELYAVNVLTMLDCLDHTQSKIVYFSDSNVADVEQFVFKHNCLGEIPIFKIPEHRVNRTFVNDAFKTLIEKNKFKGLVFVSVFNTTDSI